MNVSVALNNECHSLRISPSDTLSDIEQTVSNLLGIHYFILKYEGIELDDSEIRCLVDGSELEVEFSAKIKAEQELKRLGIELELWEQYITEVDLLEMFIAVGIHVNTILCLLIDDQTLSIQLLQPLLRSGCDINITSSGIQGTALTHAACLPDLNLINFLIKEGADIDKQAAFDQTSLMMAIREHHLSSVSLLLELGASLDITDRDGDTPLIASADNLILARLILFPSLHLINRRNSLGCTALYRATSTQTEEVAEMLLREGALPNINDEYCFFFFFFFFFTVSVFFFYFLVLSGTTPQVYLLSTWLLKLVIIILSDYCWSSVRIPIAKRYMGKLH